MVVDSREKRSQRRDELSKNNAVVDVVVVVVIAIDAQRGRTVHVAVTHAAVLSWMRVKRAMSVPSNVVVVNVEMWWWCCGKKEAV